MKSILIMGGTTFVSSSLAKYLVEKGYDVDILTRGLKPINYEGFRNHLICNRRSKKEIQKVLKGRKYEFIFDISAYTREDVEILITSIDTSQLRKYIFCSSGAVYKPSNKIIGEDFEKGENPNWGQYGIDKKEAEDFIFKSGIPFIIFRPTYIYGENNNLYREAYFFDRIKNKKAIPIPYGKGTKTQFIHIDDLIRIFESAIYNENSCKIYNVTNPDIISWEELVMTCGEVIGQKPLLKKINVNEIKLESRMYFPFRDVTYMLDIKQLIEDGLYVPTISINEGLRRAYNWYIDKKPNLKDTKMNKVDELVTSGENLKIKNIDDSNWEECIKLQVAEDQKSFIPSNLYSIAESKFQENMKLFGVYNDDVMIGFASYILDEQGDMNFYKLMIDKHYQGNGYGKEALILLIDIIKNETKNKEIWLSLHPNNAAAIRLYKDYGFNQEITGLEAEDDIFFKYNISD